MVPSKRIEEKGEWKILTDHTKCNYVHRQLTETWDDLMSTAPDQLLQETPIHFPAPMISSKRARDYQDDDSADSYGSLLTTGTEVSVITNEEETLNN